MEFWPVGLIEVMFDGGLLAAALWHLVWGRRQDVERLAALRRRRDAAAVGERAAVSMPGSVSSVSLVPAVPQVRRGRVAPAGRREPARRSGA